MKKLSRRGVFGSMALVGSGVAVAACGPHMPQARQRVDCPPPPKPTGQEGKMIDPELLDAAGVNVLLRMSYERGYQDGRREEAFFQSGYPDPDRQPVLYFYDPVTGETGRAAERHRHTIPRLHE